MYHKQHPNKDGYNKICPRCNGRWGEPKHGVRYLDIFPCHACLSKLMVRDPLMEKSSRHAMLSDYYRRDLKPMP